MSGLNSSPAFEWGTVPTAAQWASYFAEKVDATNGSASGLTLTDPVFVGTISGDFEISTGAPSALTIYREIFPGVTFHDAFSVTGVQPLGGVLVQETALAGYIQNLNPVGGVGQNAVALFGAGTAGVDGAATWGINTLLQDALSRTAGSGTGRRLQNEFDLNAMNSATELVGLTLTGNCLAVPSDANAFVVDGLGRIGGTIVRWTTGLLIPDGRVHNGADFGLASEGPGNNISSVPVYFNTTDSGGTRQAVFLQAQAGNFLVLDGTDSPSLSIASGSLFVAGGATFGSVEILTGGMQVSGSGLEIGTATGGIPGAGNVNIAGSYLINNVPIIETGTTASIGGSPLAAGQVVTGTCSVTGATTAMVAVASPKGNPMASANEGVAVWAYVSAPGVVTVVVAALVATTPAAQQYNVKLLLLP